MSDWAGYIELGLEAEPLGEPGGKYPEAVREMPGVMAGVPNGFEAACCCSELSIDGCEGTISEFAAE